MPNRNLAALPISTGELDTQITLKYATTAADAAGQMIETWATLATVWARIRYSATGDGERESAGKQTVFQTVEFGIRHRADVDEKTRVVFDGVNYDVLNIERLGRRGYLLLKAQKRQ